MISTNAAPIDRAERIKILHLEDSLADHRLAQRVLAGSGFGVDWVRVETLESFRTALDQSACQIVIADYRLNGFTAIDAWQCCKDAQVDIPFIIVSGAIGEAAAVEAIQLGISDYLHKDALATLPRTIQRTLQHHATKLAKAASDRELLLSEQRISELAGHLQTAIDREREAIAREIHDDIGGSLAAIRLDLGWLERHTVEAASLQHIAAAKEMTLHAAEASQRIMRNLRPAVLDQGLVPAIRWLANDFQARTSSATSVATSSEDILLAPEIMLTAYRTTQEALTNISKHAPGSKVRIEISDLGGCLTVEIADSGPGLPAEALKKSGSFGLRGLAERARTVGGWLDIGSVDLKGTMITLTIPLSNEGLLP